MASTHHVNISGSLYIPRTKQDDGSHSHDWMGHPLRQPYNSDGGGVNSSTTTSSSREAFTLERFVVRADGQEILVHSLHHTFLTLATITIAITPLPESATLATTGLAFLATAGAGAATAQSLPTPSSPPPTHSPHQWSHHHTSWRLTAHLRSARSLVY